MSVNGLQLLQKAGIDISKAETVCILFNDKFGQVPVDEAAAWLEKMTVFNEYDDPEWDGISAIPRDAVYGFQIWLDDFIVRTNERDGIYVLERIPRNPQAFLEMV